MFNHLQLLIGLPEVTRLDHRSIRAFAKEERGRKVGLLCWKFEKEQSVQRCAGWEGSQSERDRELF